MHAQNILLARFDAEYFLNDVRHYFFLYKIKYIKYYILYLIKIKFKTKK